MSNSAYRVKKQSVPGEKVQEMDRMSSNSQLTLKECPRGNKDERIRYAYNIYESMWKSGTAYVHKVPRAGGSTALTAESINRKEPFLAVVPNNAIASDVFVKMSVQFSDNPGANVIHVPPNHQCVLNEQLCEQYPILRMLPVLPIPESCVDKKGIKCSHYEYCPITCIIRSDNIDGCTLTYNKLVALNIAANDRPNSMASKVLDKINKMRNIILDDAHVVAAGQSVELNVLSGSQAGREMSTKKYSTLLDPERFKNVLTVVQAVDELMSDPNTKKAINDKWIDMKKPGAFAKSRPVTIPNPYTLSKYDNAQFMMACYNEIIHLARDVGDGLMQDLGFGIYDVLKLYQLMSVAMSKRVVITGTVNSSGSVRVRLVAIDWLYKVTLGKYIKQAHYDKKRIIMTSATFGCFDYDSLVHDNSTRSTYIMGHLGDPLSTCKKMTIFADKRSDYGWEEREIGPEIIKLVKELKEPNILIFATTKRVATRLNKELSDAGITGDGILVGYYGSHTSSGLNNKARIAILAGPARISKAAYDTQYEDPNVATLLHQDCEQSITYHALSRVKDHMGIENSFVFAFGIKPEQLEDIISWGPGRSEQCEAFLARCKRNNLIDDGSASVSEYFRTGHDSDNFATTNLQVVEETSFQDAPICIESIEGKGVCKNQRNEKKPFLWSTAKDKFLAKPVVYSLSKVESMIDGYRKVVGEANFLKKSFTENMNIPTKLGSRIKYAQDAEVESKKILQENGTESREVILITSYENSKSLAKDNNDNDINDTMLPYIPDYPFKTKAQRAFFGKEAKTFFVKITNKLDLLWELCYRDNAYGMQNDNGMGYHKVDEMITDELLMDHIAGKITIGAYTLWKDNTVRWICFDIDAHPDVDDSKYDMMAKINTAEKNIRDLCYYLETMHVPYTLEASGSPHSYHVWIFIKPVPAAIAKGFGRDVLKELNIKKMEVFPKQMTMNPHGYGNLVKLPFALHRKTGSLSKVWDPAQKEFVSDFESLVIGAIDISDYEPEKEVIAKPTGYVPATSGVRDIIRWGLFQNLTGEEGHNMRIAITREFWCSGLKDYAAIARLFANQADYSFEYALAKVTDILTGKEHYNRWRWETIVDKCPNMVAAYMAKEEYIP